MTPNGSIYIKKPTNLLFTTFCILHKLAFLPFELFVMYLATYVGLALSQLQTSEEVVR